jgi:hypothetical protein
MRNKRNYLIALSLACIIGTSISSNAINAKAEVDGDLSIEEGGKEYILTEEDALLDQEKLEEDVTVPFATGDFNINFNMNCTLQKNGYYCGPATVKNVLQYINSASETQNFYAGKLGTTSDGTDMTKIPAVLNKYQSRCEYVYKEFSDLSTWKSRVEKDTKKYVPVVLDIKSDTDNWRYSTSGHFLCTGGYIYNENDTDYVFICDPHPTHGGVYKVSAKKAYTVNRAHFRSAMIW